MTRPDNRSDEQRRAAPGEWPSSTGHPADIPRLNPEAAHERQLSDRASAVAAYVVDRATADRMAVGDAIREFSVAARRDIQAMPNDPDSVVALGKFLADNGPKIAGAMFPEGYAAYRAAQVGGVAIGQAVNDLASAASRQATAEAAAQAHDTREQATRVVEGLEQGLSDASANAYDNLTESVRRTAEQRSVNDERFRGALEQAGDLRHAARELGFGDRRPEAAYREAREQLERGFGRWMARENFIRDRSLTDFNIRAAELNPRHPLHGELMQALRAGEAAGARRAAEAAAVRRAGGVTGR